MQHYYIVHWVNRDFAPFVIEQDEFSVRNELESRGQVSIAGWESTARVGERVFHSRTGDTVAVAVPHKFDPARFPV